MRPHVVMLVAGLALSANSTVSYAGRFLIGDGGLSCGAWSQQRAADGQLVQLWKAWVLGFVSGANVYDGKELKLEAIDAPGIYAWIDNYCRSHPLDHVYDGTKALVTELLRRAKEH